LYSSPLIDIKNGKLENSVYQWTIKEKGILLKISLPKCEVRSRTRPLSKIGMKEVLILLTFFS
jgi:hypothetical protein